MKEINFTRIGTKIREIRLSKGLTQEYVANIADVNTSHISNNKLPRSKLRGISLDLASLGIFVKRSKLRGIRPVSD